MDFGARVTFSEMAYAREVIRGAPRERALMKRHASEPFFGVQIAAKTPEEAAEASKIVQDNGADFVDLNCGCPIHEAVKRGMGARLLRQPAELGKIVAAMVAAVSIPVTVKLRIGYDEGKVNIFETSQACEEAGATSVTIHGRTREQRYTRAADWDVIAQVAEQRKLQVAGNGDILTFYEAQRRRQSKVAALNIARGALTKPWIFQEIREQRELGLDALQRIEVYFRLATYMKEHFGDDERGAKKAANFLPWHFSLFHRYRHLPAEEWVQASAQHPLMQTRFDDRQLSNQPLDMLLRNHHESVHRQISEALWASSNLSEAKEKLADLAEQVKDRPPDDRDRPAPLQAGG